MQLFLVELRVSDWAASVAWYRDMLGLRLAFEDPAGPFALFEAGGTRLALKAGSDRGRDALRLIFQVDDLDAERRRLLALGADVGEPREDHAERYREAHLSDPDGTPIRLFSWIHTPG